ncbi:MAG: FAD-binding oxidoreductase [Pseudomonadota bacterium]
MSIAKRKILVIGAGVIGAAAAFELAARGAQVQMIDAGRARATDASFGWINASFFQTPEYLALRVAGIEAYRRLAGRLPELPVSWCGSLAWEFGGTELEAQYAALSAAGHPCRLLTGDEIAPLEPDLGTVPERAIHFTSEAAAEPSALARTLLKASGAQLLSGVQVTGFCQSDEQVTGVTTNAGRFDADCVIVAAGTGSAALLSEVGVALRLLTRPALVLHTEPVKLRLRHILATDFGEVRQLPSGALTTPAVIGHQSDSAEAVAHPEQAASVSMTRLRALFPDAELRLREMQLAYRPVPQDGFPAVGQVLPGLYTAVMHSGITLAAVMGDFIAREVLDQERIAQLGSYRPQRFAQERFAQG